MTTRGIAVLLSLVGSTLHLAAEQPTPASGGTPNLPYVYTQWKQFTVAEGLPDDHVFAVKVDGPRVWVGTEDGLALIERTACRSRP
jgi:hypothetical protein